MSNFIPNCFIIVAIIAFAAVANSFMSEFAISKYINATAGSTISMQCSTNATRPAIPDVDWKFQRTVEEIDEYICLAGRVVGDYLSRFQLLREDNTTLIINNINDNDTGIYYCIEDDAEGIRNTMYLTVHEKPTPADEPEGLSTRDLTLIVVFRVLLPVAAAALIALVVFLLVLSQRNKGTQVPTTDVRVDSYLVHTFRRVGTARGFATLDGKLCVLCKENNFVRVYDIADDYKHVQSIRVPGLRQTVDTGMMASAENHCLFISDAKNSCIHRVRLTDGLCSKWKLDESPRSVSVTLDHNVLVVCYNSTVLKIFSPDGELRSEIDVSCPTTEYGTIYHAVEFGEKGQFVVAHSNSPQLSLVRTAEGGEVKAVESFAVGLSTPRHLIDCGDGSLLAVCFTPSGIDGDVVFDKGSTKLMLIFTGPDAAKPMALVSHGDGLMCKPMRVCLDPASGLFVGDGDGRGCCGSVRLYRWKSLSEAVASGD